MQLAQIIFSQYLIAVAPDASHPPPVAVSHTSAAHQRRQRRRFEANLFLPVPKTWRGTSEAGQNRTEKVGEAHGFLIMRARASTSSSALIHNPWRAEFGTMLGLCVYLGRFCITARGGAKGSVTTCLPNEIYDPDVHGARGTVGCRRVGASEALRGAGLATCGSRKSGMRAAGYDETLNLISPDDR